MNDSIFPEMMRDVLRAHHPIMRSETGPLSGCRCGQVGLGQDVIAHVVDQLLAVYQCDDPTDSEPDYTNGGFIPGGPVPAFIHPDECLLTVDKATKRVTCRRADHPTPRSGCRADEIAAEETSA